MAETKIELEIKNETKKVCEIIEKLYTDFESAMDDGNIQNGLAIAEMIDNMVDSKKDTIESIYKKQILVAMEDAEYGEDYDEEGPVKYFSSRVHPRSATTGRFIQRRYTEKMPMDREYPMTLDEYKRNYGRDMDMPNRMYYTESGSNMGGSQGGNYGNSGSRNGGNMRNYIGNSWIDNPPMDTNEPREMRDEREGRSGMARRNYMETKQMNKGNSPMEKQENMKKLDERWRATMEDLKEEVMDMTPDEKNVAKNWVTKIGTLFQ